MAAKISKTERIKRMLADGVSASDIAKKLKTSRNYVYYVKWNAAKKGKKATTRTSVVKRKLKKSTIRDIAAAAHDAGMEVKFDIVPNGSPSGEPLTNGNALEVQVGGEHYKSMAIQPVEYIVANNLSFLEGCVVKRITRWRNKPAATRFQDLEKIKHEIDLLIQTEQRKEAVNA